MSKTNVQQNIMQKICNARNKSRCRIDGDCKSEAVIYKEKLPEDSIGFTEGNFKKRWYNNNFGFLR